MACGLPKVAEELNGQIDAAKDAAKGLAEDALGGVADAALASIESVKGAVENMVPDITPPQLNLQDELTSMIGSINDPGALVDKFANIKEKFPGVDIDKVMGDIGLDPAQLNSLNDKLKLASGINTPAGIAKLLGGFELNLTEGLDGVLDNICKKAPNIDLDAAGKEIKKGVPSILPTIDGNPLEDIAEKINIGLPEHLDPGEKLKESITVVTRDISEDNAKFLKEKNERIAAEIPGPTKEKRENNKAIDEAGTPVPQELVNKSNAINKYIELLTKDIEYDYQKKRFDKRLIIREPSAPTITKDQFDTVFTNTGQTEYGNKVKQLQSVIVIGG